jgi:hypothetical protein
MGAPLTDHEIRVLREMGKIPQAEVDKMLVDDLCPTQWRLACQMVLRD